MSSIHLAPPPPRFINPEYTVPLTPPGRPPFSHYQSSSTLPSTPQTPYHGDASLSPSKTPSPSTSLQEFIGLRARILLTTLSPALLPPILTIAHLIQNRSSTASLADSMKKSLLAACGGLATGAAGLLTMPRYLAMQTNEQAVRATQASILAIGAVLSDCVTIIEVVVTFIVDTYRSLLLCTIELVVRGTLEVVIEALKQISHGITSSLNAIRTGIQGDIASANKFIQDAVDRINSLTSKININISVPEFSIPSLSALENVQIPTGFEDSLIKLNSTIPTLAQLKDKLNELIEVPFEALKKEINETRLEMAASFNSTILPVPSLSSLSAAKSDELNQELCSDLDTSLIDDTARALHKLSNVAIGLMFLLLFLVWAAMVIWEWRRWRALKDVVEAVEDEWKHDDQKDAWRIVAIVENPVLEKYGTPILNRVAPNKQTRTNLRWYMSYLAHPTCLALLFIALLGFLSIQFQLLALNGIKAHARAHANETVTQSSNDLTAKLNSIALASSQQYATDFNAAVDRYKDRINNELFGKWLNTTAVSLNATINEFYNQVEDVLNSAFGGTILFNPVNTFMYCILGSKIDNIEKGLTWISEHAQVSLPKVPPDILLLSKDSMNEIAQPISAAAVGSSSNGEDDGVVGSLITHFEKALEVERTFYAILLGVWLGFAIIGLIIVLWNSGASDRYHSWRGSKTDGHDNTSPGFARFLPGRKEHPIYDEHTEEEKQFRGTSPVPSAEVPRIVEPEEKDSYLKYDRDSFPPPRPYVPRHSTFGSTFSSLAAPGQAFLKLAGRGKSDDGKIHLTDGITSEKYNSHIEKSRTREPELDDGLETPPPFWVNRWYRAVDTARSFFPTRGQRHGAALARNASTRSDASFGASQQPSPAGPSTKANWPNRQAQEAEWAMVDPSSIGRALAGSSDVGRYPTGPQASSYPRRMSRAPTLSEGAILTGSHPRAPVKNLFDDPPILPSKHDSVDYLKDAEEHEPYASGRDEGFMTPISSSASYVYSEVDTQAQVESADRVQTGTAALAAILANMERRGIPKEESRDPFEGGDDYRSRGVRI